MQASVQNRRVTLRSRPGEDGVTQEDNFMTEECAYPSDIQDGCLLVKTLWLSVDPYMRYRLNETTRMTYVTPWQLGDTIDGGGVALVVESKNEKYQKGEIIIKFRLPWQLYSQIKPDEYCFKVEKSRFGEHYSLAIGAIGMPGLTSLLSIRVKGHVVPGANQTIVVSGAAGACGSFAGQIARIEGCTRVVGICGTEEKCKFLTEELGFDTAINYKTENVKERLREACPAGVDVYFDNVGGEISNAVIKLMNKNTHIVLCGQISMYNTGGLYPPVLPDDVAQYAKDQNITREVFLVVTYATDFQEGLAQLATWYKQGKLKVRETVAEGLENTAKAFVSMMSGGNIGKQVVHVADP